MPTARLPIFERARLACMLTLYEADRVSASVLKRVRLSVHACPRAAHAAAAKRAAAAKPRSSVGDAHRRLHVVREPRKF